MRAPPGEDDRTTVERRDPLVGTILDQRFRIERQLAAGGFGAIYRATDVRSEAQVALKVLHPQMARDPAVVARFRREGATLSNLRDPHTITAYELGEAPDGTLYIVMELLHGESLYEQFRASGPLPWRRVVHIARGVCSSLAEAHAAGVVHRDLKPANIHLEQRGDDLDFVKVLDFGIAKIVQGGEHDRRELTQAGHMIGTVDYMSPEQMVGGEMTARSDIYTLGVVIYEMICGRTPFSDAQTATAILAAVLTRTPEPLSHLAPIPPALELIVARCLAREPQNRFADITELDEALAEVAGPARPAPVPARGYATTAFVRSARPDPTRLPARPTPPEVGPPVRPRPVEIVGGLPGRPPGSAVPPATPPSAAPPSAAPPPSAIPSAIPSSGFEPVLTNDATRIDVRFTDSSEPVLDARGRRARVPDALPPAEAYAPAALPPPPKAAGSHVLSVEYARGSQQAIEPRDWQPVPHGRRAPMSDVATPRPGARPTPAPATSPVAPPVVPPRVAPVTPLASPPPAAPARASTHEVPSYDMAAAASHDALVRRIIWLSLIVAVIIAILIATH